MLWCWRVGARWSHTTSRARPVAHAARRENPVSGRTVGSAAVARFWWTAMHRTHHSLHESPCTRLWGICDVERDGMFSGDLEEVREPGKRLAYLQRPIVMAVRRCTPELKAVRVGPQDCALPQECAARRRALDSQAIQAAGHDGRDGLAVEAPR